MDSETSSIGAGFTVLDRHIQDPNTEFGGPETREAEAQSFGSYTSAPRNTDRKGLDDELLHTYPKFDEPKKEKVENFFGNKNLLQGLYGVFNLGTVFANLGESYLSHKGKENNFLHKASRFLTKISLGINGIAMGVYQSFVNNNPLSGLAYLIKIPVSILTKDIKDLYINEGFSTALNFIALGLNHYDDVQEFKSYPDFVRKAMNNIRKASDELATNLEMEGMSKGEKAIEFFRRLLKEDSGLITIFCGLTIFGLSSLAAFSPYKKFGALGRSALGLWYELIRMMKYPISSLQFWTGAFYAGAGGLQLEAERKSKLQKVLIPLVQASQRLGEFLSAVSFAFIGEVTKSGLDKRHGKSKEGFQSTELQASFA